MASEASQIVRAGVTCAPAPAVSDQILTPQQTAEHTGLSMPSLQRMRSEGTGPCFIKLGPRRVGYRISDINAWLETRVATSTSDARVRGLSA